MDDGSCLDAAIAYQRRGWSVIPVHGINNGSCTCSNNSCSSPGKHPIGKWQHRQINAASEYEIRAQWDRNPGANVGIVTGAISGLLVVDIDDIDKLDDLPDIKAELAALVTPVAVTGRASGGFHVYLSHPSNKIGNFVRRSAGLDGRGDGGFVVAPPSMHASGKQYRWVDTHHNSTVAPASPPAKTLDLFRSDAGQLSLRREPSTPYGNKALGAEAQSVRDATEGTRNDKLNRASFNLGQLVEAGNLDADTARTTLHSAALSVGLSAEEIESCITSGLAAGRASPRANRPASQPTVAGSALKLIYFNDVTIEAAERWLLDGLIPQESLTLVFGNSGSGKSWIAVDIALRISAGMAIAGRAVSQCPVIYVAAEGQRGLKGRVAAFRKFHNVENLPFAIVPTAIDLLSADADLPRLIQAIMEASDVFQCKPGLVIIDTLSKTFGNGDENGKDMAMYVNHLGKISEQFQATVLTVHHRPKDQANATPRGHGSLWAGMDAVLLVEAGANRKLSTFKQKDAEEARPLYFDLVPVELHDAAGVPFKGAVVRYLEGEPDTGLSKQQKQALELLTELLEGNEYVGEGAWRTAWMAGESNQNEDARRKAFDRAKHKLLATGRIHAPEGKVSLVSPQDPPMDFNDSAGL